MITEKDLQELERRMFCFMRDLDEKIRANSLKLEKIESKLKEMENEKGKEMGLQVMQ